MNLHSSGTVESLMERVLNRLLENDPIDRLSIPVALLVFIYFRKSDMVFSETLVKWTGFSSRLSGL